MKRSTGLKTRHYKSEEKTVGLKPHTYTVGERGHLGKKEQVEGKTIGLIARRTWKRVACDWRRGKVNCRE
jgi:hypothetical protein